MLVHKCGKIKNWGGECRDVTSTNCSLKIYLKRALGGGGGRVGGVKMDVFFVLMLYVPVNSYGHVGTSPPISWDFYPALR